ncbi:MAG TPA: hypothetical protein VE053_03840 [Allosphingosinicella sp.]|nr:hypothetical protein [Allosphingosinicella sp.]
MTLTATLLLAMGASASAAPSAAPTAAPEAAAPIDSSWIDKAPEPPVAKRAGISIPRSAGILKLTKVQAYDTAGLDNVAQYASADEAISGTVFIYYPSLADTGLTFLATDETIRRRLGASTHIAEDKLVAVGGVAEAGRRVIYAGASEGTRSTAATIVRAGGWIIKIRVSGPASRAAEIAAALDGLSAGMTFGRNNPVKAHVIRTEDCAGKTEPDAPILKPAGGEVAALLALAVGETRDEKGRALEDVLGRVPDRLCLVRSGGEGPVELTYKVPGKTPGIYAPRLFHLVGDAGFIVEATASAKTPRNVMLLRHRIGGLDAYGLLRGSPSLAQVENVVDQDENMPLLARAMAEPEGGSRVELGCTHLKEGCKP